MEMKQAIVVRNDLKMSKGKIAAQASHASVECLMRSKKEVISEWRAQGMKKVVLKVNSLEDIMLIKRLADEAGIVACPITDAGHTEVAPGTVTCIGVGPDSESKIDKITGKLSAL